MGNSVAVNSDNFEVEVFQKSFEKPVLIDFYANWCGPCQMLKPMLENLARECDLVVAKVNTDENRQLAHDYGVEGIPDVRLMHQGEIIDRFVGVLPETKLRQFLAQHNIKSEIEELQDSIIADISAGNAAKAEETLRYLLEKYPENRRLTIEAAKFFIDVDQLDFAEQLLALVQEDEKEYFAEARSIKQLIALKEACKNPEINSELDKLFWKASCWALEGNYKEALEAFLEIVREDRSYKNDGARKAMLALFDLLGGDHPLTQDYRKQLVMALY